MMVWFICVAVCEWTIGLVQSAAHQVEIEPARETEQTMFSTEKEGEKRGTTTRSQLGYKINNTIDLHDSFGL